MRIGKQFAKTTVRKFLEFLVKIKLKRTRPTIIGITGSLGKTSTKEAVYEVLRTKWKTYRNPKSLNTEIGILLAVLEQPSGFSSPLKWGAILARAAANAFRGAKYDFVVLEYGADKPGDIKHLTSLVKPHIGIITRIARVHQAEGQFKNAEAVFEEKKKLVECLERSGTAILNGDDSLLRGLTGQINAKIFWYGTSKNRCLDIHADELRNDSTGFSATIHLGGEKTHAYFPVAGAYHINIFLPALMCGALNGIPVKEGVRALGNFKLPPGRMSVIEGQNGAVLLDSSYNASPEATKEALRLLREFPGKRKIAVIGNMNELGGYTVEAHEKLADHIGLWLDKLITVGEFAALTAQAALKKGYPGSRIKVLLRAEEAAEFLSSEISKNDAVLFKGSQNKVRLERTVKRLMAHPEEAKKLLCRQEPEWEEIE